MRAQQDDSAGPRVARLVRDLGADVFAVRREANEELARIGAAARGELEAALDDPDAEVRLRAKDLLEQIKVFEMWSPARVQCAEQQSSAGALLRVLGEKSGNHVLVGDQYGAFTDGPVTVKAGEWDYWSLLDEICRQSNNHFRPHYDNRKPGVVVVSGPPGRYPVAYAGPIRGRITTARRVFIEELNYDENQADRTHTFQFNLEMTWEDRFRLVAYRAQPELVRAVMQNGDELAAAQSSGSGWNVATPGARQLSMNLRLAPPSPLSGELDELHLRWGLLAVGDMAEIEITDLDSREPLFKDDVELAVEEFQRVQDGRWELSLSLIRDRVLPEPEEVLAQEHELELLDQNGEPFRQQGRNSAVTGHGVKLKLTFVAPNDESRPHKLRFSYPRVRTQRDVDIVFHNVPLPTGRPE